jgi:hypothetical protein
MPAKMAAFAMLLVTTSTGCPRDEPVRKTAVAQALTGSPAIQRFVVVNNGIVPIGFLALDTQTGRLCRTWDWAVPENSAVAGRGLDNLDTCREMLAHDDLWLTLRSDR